VFGLHQYLNGTGLANRGVVATYGTFFHPNMFGNFLLIISLVALYLIFSSDKKLEKILLWIYILVLLFLILNTYGRAVQLTTSFCIGIFTLRFSRKLFIFFCILGGSFFLLSTDILHSIIMRFQQTDSTGLPLSGRLLIWKPMIELFKEHPILGIGPNNWVNLHHGFAPHNEFIRFLTETGFLGFILFTSIWLSLLFKFIKMFLHNKSPLILLALLVVLSAVFLMSTSNLGTKAELQWTIWAIIGLILGVSDREKVKM
jgi:O-antigen ligase